MKLDAVKFLLDIQAAILDIENFSADIKSFNDYTSNKMLKAAIERKLLIVGEAINKFRNLEPECRIENAEKIYGLRNRLVHAYDSIDDNTVYAIIKNHLSPLKLEVDRLVEINFKK